MLSIRFQRTGRKGHAQFRIVVQDSRLTPTSGKVVARLGSYNPHTKAVNLDKEKAEFYLSNGAQPSDRAIRMFKAEGIKLPSWVKDPTVKERSVRNPEKRRSTAPAPAEPEAPEEAAADEASEVPVTEEAPVTEVAPEATPAETSEATAEEASENTTEEAPAKSDETSEPEAEEKPAEK